MQFSFKRLVQDCAIVADRGPYIGEISKPNSSSWRVAQIVGYDEVTCAHVVRYASRHTPDDPSVPLADYLLESNSHCIIDHLSFDDIEAKVVLATRDYCILRRFKHSQNETVGEENESRFLFTVSVLSIPGASIFLLSTYDNMRCIAS
jgi:hypothetical protein